jgi:hypothetical protein
MHENIAGTDKLEDLVVEIANDGGRAHAVLTCNAERMREPFCVTVDAITVRSDLCHPARRTDALLLARGKCAA